MRGDGYRPAHGTIPPRNRSITKPIMPFPCQPPELASNRAISAAAAHSQAGGFPREKPSAPLRGGPRPTARGSPQHQPHRGPHVIRPRRPVQAPSARGARTPSSPTPRRRTRRPRRAPAPPGGRSVARERGRRPCRRRGARRSASSPASSGRSPGSAPGGGPAGHRAWRRARRPPAGRRTPARLPGRGGARVLAGRGCGHGGFYSSEDPSTPGRSENQPRGTGS